MSEKAYLVNQFSQDKNEFLDYDIDYQKWLLTGETIANPDSVWSVLPTGPTLNDTPPSVSGQVTKVWVKTATCTPGSFHDVTNKITTNLGRTFEASIRILIVDR